MSLDGFTIEPAEPSDIEEIMSFFVAAFEDAPPERALGRVNTAEGRKACGEQHLHAWKLQSKVTDIPCAIKCVHTQPLTGKKTIVGFCEWFIYPRTRQEEDFAQVHYLLSGAWLPSQNREAATGGYADLVKNRIRWMGGRPVGFLMYMVVHPEWRRKNVSTMCVKWGLDKCAELGIPAYLEASDQGALVYEKLGFEKAEEASGLATMVRWPGDIEERDRVRSLPGWQGPVLGW